MEFFVIVGRVCGIVHSNDKAKERDKKEKGNHRSSNALQRMWRSA